MTDSHSLVVLHPPAEDGVADNVGYTLYSGANERNIKNILNEFSTARAATISLFEGLDDEALLRAGVADGKIMSVRTAACHIAGHEMRHINIIRERYL
ncbi:MAG: DinB family protein [Acidobacteria bacterium]|nr:DinB family protein [Acidobacteriota bacterium]